MADIDLSGTLLGNEEQTELSTYCNKLQQVATVEILSISLYGSAVHDDYRPGCSDINLLIIVDRIDLPALGS